MFVANSVQLDLFWQQVHHKFLVLDRPAPSFPHLPPFRLQFFRRFFFFSLLFDSLGDSHVQSWCTWLLLIFYEYFCSKIRRLFALLFHHPSHEQHPFANSAGLSYCQVFPKSGSSNCGNQNCELEKFDERSEKVKWKSLEYSALSPFLVIFLRSKSQFQFFSVVCFGWLKDWRSLTRSRTSLEVELRTSEHILIDMGCSHGTLGPIIGANIEYSRWLFALTRLGDIIFDATNFDLGLRIEKGHGFEII